MKHKHRCALQLQVINIGQDKGLQAVKMHIASGILSHGNFFTNFWQKLAALDQMVACLPLFQQVQGSIPGGVVNFHLKIFNFGVRRGGFVHFLIARLYITALY